jgi:hypothetical protein
LDGSIVRFPAPKRNGTEVALAQPKVEYSLNRWLNQMKNEKLKVENEETIQFSIMLIDWNQQVRKAHNATSLSF